MRERGLAEELAAASLDSSIIKLHRDGGGSLKNGGLGDRALARGMNRDARALRLSPGQVGDALNGRELLWQLGEQEAEPALLLDRACEEDAATLSCRPVIPPKCTRRRPWHYDRHSTSDPMRLSGSSFGSSAFAVSHPPTTRSMPSS